MNRTAFLLFVSGMMAAPHIAAAKTVFSTYGGQGEIANGTACGKGAFIVGFSGRVGAWIDRIQPICAEVIAGGRTGKKSYASALGGGGGSPVESACPSNEIVRRVVVSINPSRQVNAVTFYCAPLATGQIRLPPLHIEGSGRTLEGDNQACPDGEAAKGINVRWGKHVNAIGLICTKYNVPAPTTSGSQSVQSVIDGFYARARSLDQCNQEYKKCPLQVAQRFGAAGRAIAAVECPSALQRCMQRTAAAAPGGGASTPVATPASLAGVWDMENSTGDRYTFMLEVKGAMVSGRMAHAKVQNDGAISGSLSGAPGTFTVSFTQQGIGESGKAKFTMSADGQTLRGFSVPDNDTTRRIEWSGKRRQ